MYILGITCLGESAATLIRDGQLVAAAEEERFSRVKHHVGFPYHAVRYVLEEAGITIADVAHVALYWKPWVIGRRLIHTISSLTRSYDSFHARAARGVDQVGGYYLPMFKMSSLIRETYGDSDFKFHYLDHHLCHAASSYYVSPFDSTAILTIDGVGESTTCLFARGEGNRIKILKRVHMPHSLGQFYSAVTQFLGFDMFAGDEYKVMGLAAWGEPEFYDYLKDNVVRYKGNGAYTIDVSILDHHQARHNRFTDKAKKVFGPNRTTHDEMTDRHRNLAASAQKVLEETVLQMVEHLQKETGEKNLCMAGGVILNSVMNGRIIRESGFDNFFIQPAANDAGCSYGAAFQIWHGKLKNPRGYEMKHAYLGPGFSDERCRETLQKANVSYEELSEDDIPPRVASALADGKMVGWFQGRMEWGPRALGNRSFLADPRDAKMKELINDKIKLREPFRPFAPSMLADRTAEIFGETVDAPYMLTVAPVVEHMREKIPAVVHVDGTARPQTVTRESNAQYYRLIEEFDKLTGVPVVLNTSFNIHEPIVCTPDEALATFQRSQVEYLVLNRFLVSRDGLPSQPESTG